MTALAQHIDETTSAAGLLRSPLPRGLVLFFDPPANLGTSSGVRVVQLPGTYAWYQTSSSSDRVCATPVQAASILAEQASRPQGGTVRQEIAELRSLSGLTWEQTARLLGVTRRSVHFWASGEVLWSPTSRSPSASSPSSRCA